jgi:hypothetical protein
VRTTFPTAEEARDTPVKSSTWSNALHQREEGKEKEKEEDIGVTASWALTEEQKKDIQVTT